MTKFTFDHSWCIIASLDNYTRFATLGFAVNVGNAVKNPGDTVCRFINFQNGYLEFVVTDNSETTEQMPYAGFSLRADDDLKEYYESNESALREKGVKFIHRNYKWKANTKDELPGMNFLFLNKPVTPGIVSWVTEYEDQQRNRITNPDLPDTEHRNGCTKIIGAYWIYESNKDIEPFIDFLGSPIKEGRIVLDKDFTLFVDTHDEHHIELYETYRNKENPSPYKAVIVGCSDLASLTGTDTDMKKIVFNGKPAWLIAQADEAWDIIIAETEV